MLLRCAWSVGAAPPCMPQTPPPALALFLQTSQNADANAVTVKETCPSSNYYGEVRCYLSQP